MLGSLQELDLSSNRLTGTIPTELGNLSSLTELGLSHNRLDGTIPSKLGGLSNLVTLDLSGNLLTGTIPPGLGNLADLSVLRLAWNQLTGSIPTELSGLKHLSTLWLGGNQFTGCISGGLRSVGYSDLGRLGLPFCDVLLSGLSISPRVLAPAFDPYRTIYTALEGATSVTVRASNEHGAAIRFLDEGGAEIADGDGALVGLQVDLGRGIEGIRVEVTSPDGLAAHSYTVWVRPVSACLVEGAVVDGTNAGLVSDCEALLAIRDALAGSATLDWSADRPIADWEGVTVGGDAGAGHRVELLRQGADRDDSS